MTDISAQLIEQVEQAYHDRQPLAINGGGSKAFYGRQIQASALDMTGHRGIINYAPSELVVTARAGTPLDEIEAELAEHRQMLGFEPPHYASTATLGGTIACNLSGPRRPYRGAARDYVLGSHIINGKGEALHFGGEVMKNVAGYDVSRLMCGAMGTLGVLLDVSLKVIPVPETERTQVLEQPLEKALQTMQQCVLQSFPVSASCYDGQRLYIRLSSHTQEVEAACKRMGGETLPGSDSFWSQLREQQHAFFDSDLPIWRLSLAPTATPLHLEGDTLYEWGGALRWFRSEESAAKIRHTLESLQGHATLYRNNHAQLDPFHELSPGVFRFHETLKQSFDPEFILNPGRMYGEL